MLKRIKHLKLKIASLTATLSVILAIVAVLSYTHAPLKLTYKLTQLAINKPIEVNFNLEVDRKLSYSLAPSVPGSWTIKQGLLGATGVNFKPAHPFPAGSTYVLSISNLHKLGSPSVTLASQTVTITTEAPAAIASLSPAADATTVSINPAVVLVLSTANNGLRRIVLTSDATVAVSAPAVAADKTYTWHFVSPLAQGSVYHLYVDDLNQPDKTKQRLSSTSFSTVPQPNITTATTTNHLYVGDTVTITFDQPMNPAGAPIFALPGIGKWTSPTSYVFTPSSLKPGTSYSYTVPKGLASTAGGVFEADHTYSLSTPGAVYVTSSSPIGNNVDLNTTISFNFDQPVDHASAQSAFSITPSAAGSFGWSGNTMSFHTSLSAYQITYSATVAAGIAAPYGLPSARSYSQSFSTTYQITKLAVPGYLQQYAQSCEESALRMILAYRGIVVSDMDVLLRVGYNPRPRDPTTNTWDNPYLMFVGDVNGAQPTTGYGVFSGPIAAAAQSYGRSATAATNVSADWIASQVVAGNPVIVWGYSSGPRADAWNTSSGVAQTYVGEHARTIYGVAGKPGNVIGFYIHDPLYGDKYWTPAQLMANLNTFGSISNQAVVVD